MQRRDLLKNSTLLAGSALLLSTRQLAANAHKEATTDPYANQVAAGVDYFWTICDDQLALCEKLHAAIKSGNLDEAKNAYLAARPPYEEIETHALCFEETDRDIDARPYVFGGGETDDEYRGFHKIEMYLFGEGEVATAEPYAATLVESIKTLKKDLSTPENFNSSLYFEGMIGLANEVSAKKISSEEETWSDQSLIIFRHNWLGILSQYKTFRKLVEAKDEKLAERTMNSFLGALALVAPHFKPNTPAATPYSQIGMLDRRAICKASNQIRDSLIDVKALLKID
jgi:iron uptake system component EfeO